MTRLLVVTEVPAAPSIGNLASTMEIYCKVEDPTPENDFKGVHKPLHEVDEQMAMAALLVFRTPVFYPGEILVVDDNGREVGGHMRKPDKWDVRTEEFTDIETAAKRAEEVRWS